jgi:hypothetical protein
MSLPGLDVDAHVHLPFGPSGHVADAAEAVLRMMDQNSMAAAAVSPAPKALGNPWPLPGPETPTRSPTPAAAAGRCESQRC